MIAVQATTQPGLDAGRFVLRPLRKSDAGLLALYSGDARVAKGTRTIPHPLPPGAIEAYIERSIADASRETVWAMDGSATGLAELLGVISLRDMERGQSEVSFWVAPAFWNAGYASDAVKAVIDANPHGDQTIFAEVFQDNPASARVLTHAGFEYLGDAESFSVARDAMVRTWTYIRKL